MSLKSAVVGGLFLFQGLSVSAQEKLKSFTDFDIKEVFSLAVQSHRIPEKRTTAVGGITLKDKSYDTCMDYDFFVQGSTMSLYYCIDNPSSPQVIIEWHNPKSWTEDKRKSLYENLQSPRPVFIQ